MKKNIPFLRPALAGLLFTATALAANAQPYVSLDFADANQFTSSSFVMRNGGSLASTLAGTSWSSANGPDGTSGRLDVSVSASLAYSYYSLTSITPGNGFTVSYDFLASAFSAGGNSRTAIGFTPLDPSTASSSTALNIATTTPSTRLISLTGSTVGTLEVRTAENAVSDANVTLNAGSWYTFSATFIPDADAGVYQISTQLIDFTSGNVVSSASGTTKSSVTAASYFTGGTPNDLYVGFLAQGEFGGVTAIDNFTIVPATAIPEPSTYALIGGCLVMGLALMRRRRKNV